MSDNSHRSPPPLPPGQRTPTGNFKAQGSPEENKSEMVKVPAVARTRTRSGAMRATTRPDNPLAVFKDQQSLRPKADPAPTAVETPAPPAPRTPPRVPPPAPRTPPPAAATRSLPAMTPPVLPHRRGASAEVAAPATSAPNPPAPRAAEPTAERLDVTVSAVPHPRLPALTPIEPTPTALTVALPLSKEPESAPHELPQPVTTNSIPVPHSVPRKRALAMLAGATVLGALGVGGWLAVGTTQRAWTKAPLELPTEAAGAELKVPRAPAPAARAAAPVKAKAKATPETSTSSQAAQAKPAAEVASDASIPWLDGAEPNGCLPAEIPQAGVRLEDLARSQQQQTKGRQLLMQGKLEASLSALCEAARLNPAHSGIAFEVARAALIARNAATAARFAERSLALTPPDRRSKELLADALAWQGNIEAARAEWFGIHKLSAPTEKTLGNLHLGAVLEARTAAKQGDYAQAERFLRRALCFDPENVATTTQLARVLLLAGQHKAAQRWIQRALALDANDAERYVLAGDIQEALGDRSSANHHYSRALEIDPKHGVAKLRVQKQAL